MSTYIGSTVKKTENDFSGLYCVSLCVVKESHIIFLNDLRVVSLYYI